MIKDNKRNYKEEWKKEKEKKTTRLLKIDKKLNETFQEQLDKEGITYSKWALDRIEKYLKNISENT